jgi:para-aminobenzoate synthetase/4-amino-4-deoxychorismate lyase
MSDRRAIPSPGPDCSPFVLLDDARAEGAVAARLFVEPVDVMTARSAAEVPALLSALEAAQARGLYIAGYLSYEAGKGLAPAWRKSAEAEAEDMPLGWFGLFE